jgi:hypothetical protein
VTHDELLVKIGNPIDEGYQYGDIVFNKALRAVVELHRPDKRPTWLPIEFQGYGCFNCGGNYPCATIKAIQKELQ